MDLEKTIKRSRRFFRDHGLTTWAEALPRTIDVAQHEIDFAVGAGFTRSFAFPSFDHQMADFDHLVEETARKLAPSVPDNQQYREPFLADHWDRVPNGKVLQRSDDLGCRSEGAYLLLYASAPYTSAWGRTGKQIQEMFQAKGWQGLTVPEYLVLQRYWCERHGDHRFWPEPQDESGTHWLWLIDSMNETDVSVAMGNNRAINIQACKVNNRESKRAALACATIALK